MARSKEGGAAFKLLVLIRQIKEEEGKETRERVRRKRGDHYLPGLVEIEAPNSQLVPKTFLERRENGLACPGRSRMASLPDSLIKM